MVAVCLLVGCSGGGPAAACDTNQANSGTWVNPVYPNAQNVIVGTSRTGETTFKTADSPEDVLKYYDDVMGKAGREPSKNSWPRGTPSPNIVGKAYSIANCCFYGGASIEIETVPGGLNQVTIDNGWSMGCG